jgi:HK97 gp10 family phage protein
MLDVKLVRKRHAKYPDIFKAINKNFLPKAGIEVQKEVVRTINKKNIIDTARYINSVGFKVSGDQVSIGTNVEYAPYLEYGTTKMPARPAFRPALDQKRKFLVALWADIYAKVFKVMGAG